MSGWFSQPLFLSMLPPFPHCYFILLQTFTMDATEALFSTSSAFLCRWSPASMLSCCPCCPAVLPGSPAPAARQSRRRGGWSTHLREELSHPRAAFSTRGHPARASTWPRRDCLAPRLYNPPSQKLLEPFASSQTPPAALRAAGAAAPGRPQRSRGCSSTSGHRGCRDLPKNRRQNGSQHRYVLINTG